MVQLFDSLDDLIGWPLGEIVEMAGRLHLNVQVAKEYNKRKKTYYNVNKKSGNIYVAVEDGKVVEIWQDE